MRVFGRAGGPNCVLAFEARAGGSRQVAHSTAHQSGYRSITSMLWAFSGSAGRWWACFGRLGLGLERVGDEDV